VHPVLKSPAVVPGRSLIDGDADVARRFAREHEPIAATDVIDSPRFVIGRRSGDYVRGVELENDGALTFFDHAFAVIAALEIGFVIVDGVGKSRLARFVASPVARAVHFLRLIDPGERAFRTRDAGGFVIAAPKDKRLSIVESRLEIAAERFA